MIRPLYALALVLSLVATSLAPVIAHGQTPTWAPSTKEGVGTAYAPYGPGRDRSKVWFSLAQGMLTETEYGLIHQAQIKTARIAVVTETGLVIEGRDTTDTVSFLAVDEAGRPLAPAYRLTTRDRGGRVEIVKDIFTDPDHNVVFVRVTVRALHGKATPYLLVEPHMDNVATANLGFASRDRLSAHQSQAFVSVLANAPFLAASADPLGSNDAEAQLQRTKALSAPHANSGDPGAVVLGAQLGPATDQVASYDLAFGFGATDAQSVSEARASLKAGYAAVLAAYVRGWSQYLSGLSQLPRLAAQATDGGKLAFASALALKVQEDKTYPGALIASLSNPWGDTVRATQASTGYKAVWPRDFYQCAMALAALGDTETPVAAVRYLKSVQVAAKPDAVGGWFQQKSHVDGTPEWFGVQMDQTAMPIMLAWKLNHLGLISDAELQRTWEGSLRPAADFLVQGGEVRLGTNHRVIHPPATEMERWEEKAGYSPSTMAAEITGLVLAGDLAARFGEPDRAKLYSQTAKAYSDSLEGRTAVRRGALADHPYYLRIVDAERADLAPVIPPHNGLGPLPADQMVDAGFLELVRYGVRRADDPLVVDSLKVIDDQSRADDLRVRYDFHLPGDPATLPGFRRYGHDGYGEDQVTGEGYAAHDGVNSPNQRGRVWPLLTGERGHYELALALVQPGDRAARFAAVRQTYVHAMERFANAGLMLPEQVYDGVGSPLPSTALPGQGTDSATPLSWAHAEYVKLLRSLADKAVFDAYPPVGALLAK